MRIHRTNNAILGVLIGKRFQLINLKLVVDYIERKINIIKEILRSNENLRLN